MKAMLLTALVALSLPTISGAQEATTTCGAEFGRWVCHTRQPEPRPLASGLSRSVIEAGRRGWNDSQARFDQIRQNQERAAEVRMGQLRQAEDENAQRIRLQVSQATAEGRCEDAKQLALKYGMMDLAEQSLRLCAPR